LYKENQEDDQDSESESKHIKLDATDLKKNKVSWNSIVFKETFSNPPTRYNEPSLVKKLEGLGIGRPSTYAAIISKIQEHKYIRFANIEGTEKSITTYTLSFKGLEFNKKSSKQKIGNEKGKLVPTDDGILITNYLIENFPQIMDYKFTAKMELLLDDIAEGKKVWYEVLSEFYEVLKEQFTKLNLNIDTSYYVKHVENKVNEDNSDESKIANPLPIKLSQHQIIGKHPKYGDITYMETKYGFAFKVTLSSKAKKDLFVGAGKLKPTDANVLESAIKYIDYKISKSTDNKTTTGKKK
jgi:hypothetical protein